MLAWRPRQGAPAIAYTRALDTKALEPQFHRLGWCPHHFHRLQQTCKPETLRYLSTLDRRHYRPNNHHECKNHPCCVANNVKTEGYDIQHTQTCSGSCPLVGVDYSDILSIIRAGGIPIISIHVGAASPLGEPVLHLGVTPRTVSTRYTVISHVWFDGLGNPFANALPTCQVRRLYTQLLSLPPDHESGVFSIGSLQVDWSRQSFVRCPERQPPLFWMDTLCIPVGSEHAHLRKKAINQMASVYAAAVQELVLDAELMQSEAGTSPALETIARVACSAWMTRSWTLQEGVLARECVFQFKDRAIDPIHEWCLHGRRPGRAPRALAMSFPPPTSQEHWAVYTELYNVLWDTLHQDWKSKYRKDPPKLTTTRVSDGALANLGGFRAGHAAGKVLTLPAVHGLSTRGQDGLDKMDHFTMQLGEEHRIKQLVDTWNELAHRSTTMPEDLHVIIANLLDFNADGIMSLPTREERMRAMILSFGSLPVSLFWNTGPKWRENSASGGNNEWIPIEPSKSELSLTPVMKVSAEWLDLDLCPETTGKEPSVLVLLLRENGVNIVEQTAFLCSISSQLVYDVTLFHAQRDDEQLASHSIPGEFTHYLIIENCTRPTTAPIKGALFRGLPSQGSDKDGAVRLSYMCPVTLCILQRDLSPDEPHATASESACTNIAVKYGQSPPDHQKTTIKSHPSLILTSAFSTTHHASRATYIHPADHPSPDPIPTFTRHPRRLNRGPSLQGSVSIILLFPLPILLGIICMVSFIIVMARPPHTFTPTAKSLLAAFIVLYFGSALVGAAWLFLVEALMYRMWLASFESGWAGEERESGKAGWWARYVAFERWLRGVEHAVYTRVKRGLRGFQKPSTGMSGGGVDGPGEVGSSCSEQ